MPGPFLDPWVQRGSASSPIDFDRQEYERTGNPMYVWRAYSVCRELLDGDVIASFPDWILAYFDRVVENLKARVDTPPSSGRVATAVAEAFEFKDVGQTGRGTPFSRMNQDQEAVLLAASVRCHLRAGHKLYLAIEYAAQEHGVSATTAQRAYAVFESVLTKSSTF